MLGRKGNCFHCPHMCGNRVEFFRIRRVPKLDRIIVACRKDRFAIVRIADAVDHFTMTLQVNFRTAAFHIKQSDNIVVAA